MPFMMAKRLAYCREAKRVENSILSSSLSSSKITFPLLLLIKHSPGTIVKSLKRILGDIISAHPTPQRADSKV